MSLDSCVPVCDSGKFLSDNGEHARKDCQKKKNWKRIAHVCDIKKYNNSK